MSKREHQEQADLVLMLPAFVFLITGGALGAMFGVGAATLSVRAARHIDRTPLKWAAAFAIYTVVGAIWIVTITAFRAAVGK
jgi:hypothetical protein